MHHPPQGLEHPCPRGEHPNLSLWTQEPGEGKGVQSRKEAVFSFLSKATSVGGLLALN